MGPGFYAQTGEGDIRAPSTTGEGASRSRSFGDRVNPQRGGPTSCGGDGLVVSEPPSFAVAKRAVPAPSAGYQGAETMRAGPSDGGIARTVSRAKSGPQASPLGPPPSGAPKKTAPTSHFEGGEDRSLRTANICV
jgi:hypothetical protein